MSRDQQRLEDCLAHILEAVERIERYTEDMDELRFLSNELIQDAVIRNFEIIGEASHNIEAYYPAFAKKHPELPLAFAYQMRNAVAHGYSRSVMRCMDNDPDQPCAVLHANQSHSRTHPNSSVAR